MASSIVITVKSDELTQAQAQQRYQLPTGNPKEEARALADLFHRAASGAVSLNVDVQTAAAAPVAASGTWTLASVIATDVASVAGVDFTFTSSPTLSTDVEVDVPSAKAFASATDISLVSGQITESSHGYATGDIGQLSTSSALPTGFAASTDYYVIRDSANAYRLASSAANAAAGIAIIPTAVGTGNQTLTLTVNTYVAASLAAAVNAHATVSQVVVATAAGAVVTVTARQKGVVGNFIQFSDGDSTITSAPTSGYLAGGTGGATDARVNYTLGVAAT